MLIRFGIKNHLSIREYQEVSLVATKLKDVESGLIAPMSGLSAGDVSTHGRAQLKLVPVVAVYGANASGKSTLLDGLRFFVNFIRTSQTRGDSEDGVPHHPFLLDENSRDEPSVYDADIVIDETRFHYGYAINGKRILSEWLYSYPLGSLRQTRSVLFHRDSTSDEEFHFGKSLRGENKQISRLVRGNSLFLSAAAQNAHEQLIPIYEFFRKKVIRISDQGPSNPAAVSTQLQDYFGEDTVRRAAAIKFLKAADVGVSDMNFSKVQVPSKAKAFMEDFGVLMKRHLEGESFPEVKSEIPNVDLMHAGIAGKSYKISMAHESAGTVSLLKLLGPALARLADGGVLLVDELNTTLHPLVTRELLRLFSSPESNPGRAQLLFSTHDTNVLAGKLLRRDQIWFAEKDSEGASHIYSMAEIKVRGGDNLEAGYLAGRFGAIPYFGSTELTRLNHCEEEE
jgi:uncharacterized protein